MVIGYCTDLNFLTNFNELEFNTIKIKHFNATSNTGSMDCKKNSSFDSLTSEVSLIDYRKVKNQVYGLINYYKD